MKKYLIPSSFLLSWTIMNLIWLAVTNADTNHWLNLSTFFKYMLLFFHICSSTRSKAAWATNWFKCRCSSFWKTRIQKSTFTLLRYQNCIFTPHTHSYIVSNSWYTFEFLNLHKYYTKYKNEMNIGLVDTASSYKWFIWAARIKGHMSYRL